MQKLVRVESFYYVVSITLNQDQIVPVFGSDNGGIATVMATNIDYKQTASFVLYCHSK